MLEMKRLHFVGIVLGMLVLLTNCGKKNEYYQPRNTPVEKIFYKNRQSFYVSFPNFVDEQIKPNQTYAINYEIPGADKLGNIEVAVQSHDGYNAVIEKIDNSKGIIRITTPDTIKISEIYFIAKRQNETPVLYSINMKGRITISIPSTIFASRLDDTYPVDLPLSYRDYIVSIPDADRSWITSEKGDSIIDESEKDRKAAIKGKDHKFFERFRDFVVDAVEAFDVAPETDELTEKDFPKYENLLPFRIASLNKPEEQDSMVRYSIIRLVNEQGEFLKTIFITQTNVSKITINVEKPGTLINNIYFGDYESITKLAIAGNADSSDFVNIRNFKQLKHLDLSNLNTTKLTCKINNPYIETVIMPNKPIEIGEKIFEDCLFLRKVDLSNVTVIGNYAFSGCGVLSDVTFSDNLVAVGAFSFSNCKQLENVVLPATIDTIGRSAFSYCENLKTIKFEESGEKGLTSISHFAFGYCTSLTSIKIPATIKFVGERVFYGCNKLTKFYGDNTTADGRAVVINNELRAFLPSGLTRYTIPNYITTIGEFVFFSCNNLSEIVIPKSVKDIRASAFFGCGGLKSIKIPNSVENIRTTAFAFCSKLEKIELPESVTKVEDWAFDGCVNLKEVKLSSATTEIDAYAFSGCESLEKFIIPEQTNNIGDYAFSGCTNIKEISVPDNVKSLGTSPFQSCFNLSEIRCGAITPPTLQLSLGDFMFKLNSVFVPQPSIDSYKSADTWTKVADKMQGTTKNE